MDYLKTKLTPENYQKLIQINNPALHQFIAQYAELCNPDRVFVSSDSPEDIQYIRQSALRSGGEKKLAIEGHTFHFDGYYDQGRDKEHTKLMLPKGIKLGPEFNSIDKEAGYKEVHGILKNIMRGKELYICFFCLGPTNSEFSIPCVQLTDSSYVAHSAYLLYRPGYEDIKKSGPSARFFRFIHSAGELNEAMVSKNIDKRLVYIDTEDEIVYSLNTQYGGNSIGLKKLALRLAIKRASAEDWLAEHMFLMGVHGPNQRVTYFSGAFPSLCGKTSTSMLTGETIVGDDIAYLRKRAGIVHAVNAEAGMFGIIMGINSKDDVILWEILRRPGEIIFSNVLVTEEHGVYWIGKDGAIPIKGFNHSGEWHIGKTDAAGNEIPPSHKNARFTLNLRLLKNMDPRIDDSEGVALGGIIYGGRDSDTCVPVEEAFDWAHGIITRAASLESETTAATLGKEGIRTFNPMANLDFLAIPLGKYIENNLNFAASLKNPPLIFSVNYFLKDAGGHFLNDKQDKAVWLKWMELRVNNEILALRTPTGLIPQYQDLKRLFDEILHKDYHKEDYIKQFTIRIPENLAKVNRIIEIYKTKVPDAPSIVFKVLEEQKQRLNEAKGKYGTYVSPEVFSIKTEKAAEK